MMGESEVKKIEVLGPEKSLLAAVMGRDKIIFRRPVKDIRYTLDEVLETLTKQERDVLRERFGFDGPPKVYRRIGEKFNLTTERARQLALKGIRRLRHPSRMKKIRPLIDVG